MTVKAPLKGLDTSPSTLQTDDRVSQTVIIAIVGYRSAEKIRACLTALVSSTYDNFRISICENGGRAASSELLSRLAGLADFSDSPPQIVDERVAMAWQGRLHPKNQPIYIYTSKSNIGFAGGVNVSIRQSECDPTWSAIWLLNPDTEPAPQALQALVDRARNGDYAVVGSRIVFQSSRRVQLYGGRWRPLVARGFNIGLNSSQDAYADPVQIERSMSYVSGASFYATRDFIKAVGLMREEYFLYCEDVDWCLRRRNLRLGYAHASTVYHDHGSTIGSHRNRKFRSKLSVYLDERNKLLITRNFYPLMLPIVIPITLLLTGQYLIHGAFYNFIVALSGWLAGVRGEIGPPHFVSLTEALP